MKKSEREQLVYKIVKEIYQPQVEALALQFQKDFQEAIDFFKSEEYQKSIEQSVFSPMCKPTTNRKRMGMRPGCLKPHTSNFEFNFPKMLRCDRELFDYHGAVRERYLNLLSNPKTL